MNKIARMLPCARKLHFLACRLEVGRQDKVRAAPAEREFRPIADRRRRARTYTRENPASVGCENQVKRRLEETFIPRLVNAF